METKIKVFGRITNFKEEPVKEAIIRLLNDRFEDIYNTFTDEEGNYELFVQKGLYYTFYACKDYNINYLEYWAWNLPLFNDIELNAKIDGLEVYTLTAFRIKQGFPQLMLYFRPMSLKRAKTLNQTADLLKDSEIIDISPDLSKDDIKVTINNEASEIYEINKVLENGGNNQRIYSYLIHVSTNKVLNTYDYNRIDIKLFDKETMEQGEGTLFWKEDRTIVSQ